MQLSPELETEPVNIFALTKENLKELSKNNYAADHSRRSLIQIWRDKVQKSRERQSIIKEYDDIQEMINDVVQNDNLNFTNTILNTKIADNAVNDDSACGESACSQDEAFQTPALEFQVKSPKKAEVKSNISLGQFIQKVAQAHLVNAEDEFVITAPNNVADSSYYSTADALANAADVPETQIKDNLPRPADYFVQMAETYVHTDDENGLVFYETKWLSNQPKSESNLKETQR